MGTMLPPVAVFAICAFGMWEAHYFFPHLSVDIPGGGVLAALFFALGGWVAVWAVISFSKAKTTVDPTDPRKASSLVTTGVYFATRNPMYLGLLLALSGIALLLSNPLSFLMLPLFAVWMTYGQIRAEERALRGIFGEEYERYTRNVGRWFWKF